MTKRPDIVNTLASLHARWKNRTRRRYVKKVGPSRLNANITLLEVGMRIRGRDLRVFAREGTVDLHLIDIILCNGGEYELPQAVQPKVIFDIGANIGITALYYSVMYPEAEIYCFEPLPENLELLQLNAQANNDRISVMPYGLSNESGTFRYRFSGDAKNFGGGGFAFGCDANRDVLVLPVKSVEQALNETGVAHVDVFKIDTEGSEWPILRGIPDALLEQSQALIGELHSVDDWQFCQRLSQTHNIGIDKSVDRTCYPFIAMRKAQAGAGAGDGARLAA